MKQTILGEEQAQTKRRVQNRLFCCVGIIFVAAVLNVFFIVLRTKENHTLMLMMNILVDLAAGWIMVWNVTTFVAPLKKCLRLQENEGILLSGTVENVFEGTERYCGFDCIVATIAGHKVFVVDNGNIRLTPSEQVTVIIVQGIVKEVV